MAQLTIQQALALALQHHQAGRFPEAEQLYRQVLAHQSNHPDALHLLGVLAHQLGKNDVAIHFIRRAIAVHPNFPEACNNLGNALKANRQLDDAIAAYQQALALKPHFPEAHNNLGNVLRDQGKLGQAIAAYRQAIADNPNYPEACYNLGIALLAAGRFDEAIATNRRAIVLRPNYPEAHNNLGIALKDKRQLDEAIAAFRQAVVLHPTYAEAHGNLGSALWEKGNLDEALIACRQAIKLHPNFAEAHRNLGVVLSDCGQIEEAIAAYRTALQLQPDFIAADSNLVYTLHFHPAYDGPAIHQELMRWNQQHAAPLQAHLSPHTNDRTSGRRLKIGYVSPDFYAQAESFFTVPLLENHDHSKFEIFCYSSVLNPDHITTRLQKCADVWREVRQESDSTLASMIRDDRIDILVDLTMHMRNNRALLFARKPAPVQVCWLAYPGGTGLQTMNYRLTDSFMDPAAADACYSEISIRLPDCWVVYDPLIDLPPRPAEQTGPITFGSLNNPAKLNDPLLTLWAKVLQATAGSRLLLQVLSLEHQQRIKSLMERQGVAAERIEFVGRLKREDYLRLYNRVDIALDPLPYNGITTTCDALYMGTPVLTLAGHTAAGRAGKAMLTTIGLNELVAHTPDEFVQKATALAADLPHLTHLRATLRQRLQHSPLMNAPRFARHIETAYQDMWQKRCHYLPPTTDH